MIVDFCLTRLNAGYAFPDSGKVEFDVEICAVDDHMPCFVGITEGDLTKGFGIVLDPTTETVWDGMTGEPLLVKGEVQWSRSMPIRLEVERFGSIHLPRFALGDGYFMEGSAFLFDPESLYCAVVGRIPGQVDPFFENWDFRILDSVREAGSV